MRQDQFLRVTSAIQSLKSSTDVNFYVRLVRAEVRGRCSPYVSHRSVEFCEAVDVEPALYIENGKYALRVFADASTSGADLERATGFICDVINEFIPAELVRSLVIEANVLFHTHFCVQDDLVRVQFAHPRATGWVESDEVVDSITRTVHHPTFTPLPDPNDEPPGLIEFRTRSGVQERLHKGFEYVFEVPYDSNRPAPYLEPVSDGLWHEVSDPHRVGCTIGFGWYRSV